MNAEKQIDDGGPAFPIPLIPGEVWTGSGTPNGMSLRDWFAGQALAGLVFHNDFGMVSDQDVAKGAYSYADTMLVAREQQNQ